MTVNFESSTGLVPRVSSYTEYLFIYLTDAVYQRKDFSDALHSVLLAKEKESNAQWSEQCTCTVLSFKKWESAQHSRGNAQSTNAENSRTVE